MRTSLLFGATLSAPFLLMCLQAQVPTGTLNGIARDSQGKSISDACVQATDIVLPGNRDISISALASTTSTFNRVVNAFGLPSRQLLADATLINGQGSAKSGTGLRLVARRDLSQSHAHRHNSGDSK
jgi:hypothetical protein